MIIIMKPIVIPISYNPELLSFCDMVIMLSQIHKQYF